MFFTSWAPCAAVSEPLSDWLRNDECLEDTIFPGAIAKQTRSKTIWRLSVMSGYQFKTQLIFSKNYAKQIRL